MTPHRHSEPLRSLLVVSGMLLLAGCSGESTPPPEKTPAAKEPGVTRTLVEEMSGYRAAQQGQKMKEKIRDISAEHNADMSAVLDDPPDATVPGKK